MLKKLCSFALVLSLLFNVAASHAESLPFYTDSELTPRWLEDPAEVTHQIQGIEFNDQNGEKISTADLEGKIHVANFFFTSCPGICPRLMSNMKRVQQAFRDSADVRFLSFSVMPSIDSIEKLKSYSEDTQFGAKNWHLLTGEKDQIYQVARRSYFADKSIGSGTQDDFLHTEHFMLVDSNLRIRGVYNGVRTPDMKSIIEDIQVLLDEKRG